MSTGLIVVIVVVVLVLLAVLLFAVPRMRERARLRARERDLEERRSAQIGEDRRAADQLSHRANQAERRARIAEAEANKQRAEAELHQEHADVHEQGLADDELISDDERDRFQGTSAVPSEGEAASSDDDMDRERVRTPDTERDAR
jgi:hypothetical protein